MIINSHFLSFPHWLSSTSYFFSADLELSSFQKQKWRAKLKRSHTEYLLDYLTVRATEWPHKLLMWLGGAIHEQSSTLTKTGPFKQKNPYRQLHIKTSQFEPRSPMIKDFHPCPGCLQTHKTAVYDPNVPSFSTHLLQWRVPIIHTRGFPQH